MTTPARDERGHAVAAGAWTDDDPRTGSLSRIFESVEAVIVGQTKLVQRMAIAMLAEGHVLLEGVPGLAKTLSVRTLAGAIQAGFGRVQFTPDLLPSDLIGTNVYDQRTGEFSPRKGPIFTNILLADEINRAPAKVQSALLEAMQERQVTIAGTTHPLPHPFTVLATQNPIEQEGTYPLPEAQVDRFMLKVVVGYPSFEEEKAIVRRMSGRAAPAPEAVAALDDLERAKAAVEAVRVDAALIDYIVRIVQSTRSVGLTANGASRWVEYGASPRASIWLTNAAKAHAFLCGRDYVKPEDVKELAPDVLRHRVIVTFEAQAEGVTPERVIDHVLQTVPVP